jgi:hypothetical protein
LFFQPLGQNNYFCCPKQQKYQKQIPNPNWNLEFWVWDLPGAVAQSVEQRTENPCVGGSIPPHTTEIN